VKQFESAEPGSTTVDEIRAQLKVVDERYYQLMMTISDDAKKHRLVELNTCCGENPRDPIARLVCGLALYLTGQNTPEQFVKEFPVSGNLDPLWALDLIAGVKEKPDSLPPLFGPDGPAGSYATELFRLVTKGDKPALQKYLQLYLRADGGFAEFMEDQVEHMFSEHPEVVLDNWDALKSNGQVVPSLLDSLSEDEKRRMR
jgi:hypothetical protein